MGIPLVWAARTNLEPTKREQSVQIKVEEIEVGRLLGTRNLWQAIKLLNIFQVRALLHWEEAGTVRRQRTSPLLRVSGLASALPDPEASSMMQVKQHQNLKHAEKESVKCCIVVQYICQTPSGKLCNRSCMRG